jgi:DNA-binding transcriptional LysR family regulator
MELRHLRYVVAVAETLHFHRAAERLNMSQPPLSQQIQKLEEELGIKLFHRTKRDVQLTDAGKLFVQEARMVLAQADHMVQLKSRFASGDLGPLTVGVAGPADAPIFIDIFRLFAKRVPNVSVLLRNIGTAQQAEAIRECRLHVGFLVPPIDADGLTVETVMHRPIVIALPRTHRLAARKQVPLTALARERHIMLSRDLSPTFFDATVNACREAGLLLNVAHQVDNVYSACALVAAGLGVSFVPGGTDTRSRSVVLRPVTPALAHVDSPLALAYKTDAECNLVRGFVKVVKEVTAKPRRSGRLTGTPLRKRRPGMAPVA